MFTVLMNTSPDGGRDGFCGRIVCGYHLLSGEAQCFEVLFLPDDMVELYKSHTRHIYGYVTLLGSCSK